MNTKLLLAIASSSLAVPAAASQDGASASSALFPGVAYVEMFDPAGAEFTQVLFGSTTVRLGPMEQFLYSAGFANNDFSIEYAIDYLVGDLYSIDTSNGVTRRIGPTINRGIIPYGPKWNPQTNTSYIVAPDASCNS